MLMIVVAASQECLQQQSFCGFQHKLMNSHGPVKMFTRQNFID